MKIPTMLLDRVLLDEGLQISVTVERDSQEIASRFEHEGMSFLTITLPSLCDALDQGLAHGRISPSMFNGFKPFKRGGKLPALLSGFFMRVFNLDGSLKETPCIASIGAIRLVTRLFKKVELPCSSARVKQAFERYVSNDESINSTSGDFASLRIVAGYLWSDLQSLSGALYCAPGVFGTGATAERLAFNERHSLKQWPKRGDHLYPLAYHGASREDDIETLAGIELLGPEAEQPVRVVQVPKTLKTPRIISVEPSYMMLRQQSIAKLLMGYLESDLFKVKSIRFTNQTVNNEMARIGSLDGSLATIDLKDASDMVCLDLVRKIFSVCPEFLEYIEAARSTRAQMPDKSIVELRKYASMGSALCFPIEAMVFYTIVMMSMVRQSGRRMSNKLLTELSARVSVYGDDIIVPAEMAAGVMQDLESFGLKVNHDKSFTTGYFRESCGGDYYKGHDVTPVYVRQWDVTGSTRDARILSSYISLSNQLYLKGCWNASQYIRDHVTATWGTIPRTRKPCGALTFASVLFDTGVRWDQHLYGYRVKGFSLRAGRREDPVRDVRAAMLLRFGPQHLGESISSTLQSVRYSSERPQGATCWSGRPREQDANGARDTQCAGHDEARHLRTIRNRTWRNPETAQYGEEWLAHYVQEKLLGRLKTVLDPVSSELDLTTSVSSYALNAKRRWTPVQTGLPSW
jgi:hypothetical protein